MGIASANTPLVHELERRGWPPRSLESLRRYPLPIRNGASALELLAGMSKELAAAIDSVTEDASEGAEDRGDIELLCEAILAVHSGVDSSGTIQQASRANATAPLDSVRSDDAAGPGLVLIVDSAERVAGATCAILAKLQARGVRCERRPLAVGDYCWILRLSGPEQGLLARLAASLPIPAHSGGVPPARAAPRAPLADASTTARAQPREQPQQQLQTQPGAASVCATPSAGASASTSEVLLPWICERKTCSDLASSVLDGRYHEQKFRLAKAQALGVRHVAYLVEGVLLATPRSAHPARVGAAGAGDRAGDRAGGTGGRAKAAAWRELALPSAVAKTVVHSRFCVGHTRALDESVAVLAAVHARLQAALESRGGAGALLAPACWAAGSQAQAAAGLFLAVDGETGLPLGWEKFGQRLRKRDDESVGNVWAKMVMQVRGVSDRIAEAVVAQYPTPAALRAAFRACGTREAALAAVSALRLRGEQSRRVGPAAAAHICDAFAPARGGWPGVSL